MNIYRFIFIKPDRYSSLITSTKHHSTFAGTEKLPVFFIKFSYAYYFMFADFKLLYDLCLVWAPEKRYL